MKKTLNLYAYYASYRRDLCVRGVCKCCFRQRSGNVVGAATDRRNTIDVIFRRTRGENTAKPTHVQNSRVDLKMYRAYASNK